MGVIPLWRRVLWILLNLDIVVNGLNLSIVHTVHQISGQALKPKRSILITYRKAESIIDREGSGPANTEKYSLVRAIWIWGTIDKPFGNRSS